METLLRERLASVLALIAASAAVPAALVHFLSHETVQPPSIVHFLFIVVASLTGAGAAISLSVVGARRSDGRSVIVATAFSTMSAILAVHGLATPGILVGANGVIAFAGGVALPVGAAVLALSALPRLHRPEAVAPLLALQACLLAAVVILGAIGLAFPSAVPAVPRTASGGAVALLALGMTFFGLLAVRAAQTFVLTRRRSDLVVMIGISWLGVALFSQLMVPVGAVGWWIGHILELVGVALVAVPVALDLRSASPSRPLCGDLRGEELVAAEEAYLGPHVCALTQRLADKDAYTAGHTRRVALLAVRVGEELDLSPGRLRSLAIGGLMHDIGKLSVPDAILQKPGSLDDEEFAEIRRHPEAGYRLLHELGGFPERACRLVRDHHERLDGSGYPRGLSGEDLDLETRILCVCDVHDALVSARVYREPWSPERAWNLLRSEADESLDARSVAALERVLARDWPDAGQLREARAGAPAAMPA